MGGTGAGGEGDIFVSIAAYRDPELGPTIEDCRAKASFPDRLRFGVCWQHAADEPAPPCFGGRVDVIDVDWAASRGACWARAEIMKLWRGEQWFLQLDSHHRFVPGWDVILTEQAARCDSPCPVLTTYAPAYTPGAPDPPGRRPMRIELDRFAEDGVPTFRPARIAGWEERARPYRGRFASAHFFFAPGGFVHDVPYDPDLYFIGEEITLAVRAFTHGYDLFVPSRLVLWHGFTAASRRKHWDDHLGTGGPAWYELEARSRAKIASFLTDPWVGPFGCGPARTLADYEAYAGINFRHRRAEPAWVGGRDDERAGGPSGHAEPASARMGRLVETWLDTVRDELGDLLEDRPRLLRRERNLDGEGDEDQQPAQERGDDQLARTHTSRGRGLRPGKPS